jgi:hypothetical protein
VGGPLLGLSFLGVVGGGGGHTLGGVIVKSAERRIERLERRLELQRGKKIYRPTPEEIDELLAGLKPGEGGAAFLSAWADRVEAGSRLDLRLLRDDQLDTLEQLLTGD